MKSFEFFYVWFGFSVINGATLQAQVNGFHSETVGKKHVEPKTLSLIPTAYESCLLFTSNKVTPSQKPTHLPAEKI